MKKVEDKTGTLSGWRKLSYWTKKSKSLMRAVGQVSKSGGKNKAIRLEKTVGQYLNHSQSLVEKLTRFKSQFVLQELGDILLMMEFEHFLGLANKHIDLLERRVLKGEKIPHEEKMFSVFEPYTDWISKGKQHPNVELGKNLAITTDQYHLIVDYHIMEKETDSQIVKDLIERVIANYKVNSWSFDKGFWHKENKALLKAAVAKVVMPKKGKPNKKEVVEENEPIFKKLKKKHSAVESNINELEHRGLNRCPDKSYPHFKRYIGLAVAAYNLNKIGKELLRQQKQAEQFFSKKRA